MLKFLKRFGKGFATITGLSTVAAGGAITLSVDPSVNEALARVGEILATVGALLTAFGVGRKAGVA